MTEITRRLNNKIFITSELHVKNSHNLLDLPIIYILSHDNNTNEESSVVNLKPHYTVTYD